MKYYVSVNNDDMLLTNEYCTTADQVTLGFVTSRLIIVEYNDTISYYIGHTANMLPRSVTSSSFFAHTNSKSIR